MRIVSPCIAMLGLFAPLLAESAAPPLEVEEISLQGMEWAEDFEGGELFDGDRPFEPIHWWGARHPLKLFGVFDCIDDSFVEDGALVMTGPVSFCTGAQMTTNLRTAGDATLRATYRNNAAIEDLDGFGVSFRTAFNDPAVWLFLQRIDALGGYFVQLLNDPSGAPSLIDAVAIPPPTNATELVFELSLKQEDRGGVSVRVPSGTLRVCNAGICQDFSVACEQAGEGACVAGSADDGAISSSVPLLPSLVAIRNGSLDPFRREVEEVSLSYTHRDDFSDGSFFRKRRIFSRLSQVCVSRPTRSWKQGRRSRSMSSSGRAPWTHRTTASISLSRSQRFGRAICTFGCDSRFAFRNPAVLTGAGIGGLSFSLDPGAPDPLAPGVPPIPFLDSAGVAIVRSTDPDDPSGRPDALMVTLLGDDMSFFGGPAIPIVAKSVLSPDIEKDASLAAIRTIELDLSVANGLPTARYRLCANSGCEGPFQSLAPRTPTAFSGRVGLRVAGEPIRSSLRHSGL